MFDKTRKSSPLESTKIFHQTCKRETFKKTSLELSAVTHINAYPLMPTLITDLKLKFAIHFSGLPSKPQVLTSYINLLLQSIISS